MKKNLLVHKHLIVRAESKRPIKDEEHAVEWMGELIESLKMRVFLGPYAKYCDMEGNRGLTVVAIIETSHIVMHIWDEVNPALIQLDIYSCGDFDEHDICKKISKDFDMIDKKKILSKHKKHHSIKHISEMKKEMKKGVTFKKAHKRAIKKVGV